MIDFIHTQWYDDGDLRTYAGLIRSFHLEFLLSILSASSPPGATCTQKMTQSRKMGGVNYQNLVTCVVLTP
jgi:hypothetical protein